MPVKVNHNELVDDQAELPRTQVMCAIHQVAQEPSKKFNAMDTLSLEIVAPEKVVHAGKEVKITGRKFTIYVTYSEGSIKKSVDSMRVLGVPIPDDYDYPTSEEVESRELVTTSFQELTKQLEGAYVTMTIQTEPWYKTDNGRFDGTPMRDSRGQKIIGGHQIKAELSQVIGPAVRGQDAAGKPVLAF